MDRTHNTGTANQGDNTMTTNETNMLLAILGSDYVVENPTDSTWLWDVTERFGDSAGGIMASLVKKGWAGTTGLIGCDPGGSTGADEGTCWMTPAGVDALYAKDKVAAAEGTGYNYREHHR